ncbi:hypothetical protein [Nocardioides sp. LHG3406-4]|uniref:hypothetical protein n=1 Tax=Nocardioides sp. LHG3406-4 TaxID=2804575 RepID=UPI003CEC9EF4
MRPSEPRTCNRCAERVILARRWPTGAWRAYEAKDRPPFTQEATGAHVLIAGQAWTVADLIEDYMVRHELTEDAAKEIVSGFPFHRPHYDDPPHTQTDDSTGGTT